MCIRDRLKRWISSTNSSVPCPARRRSRLSSQARLRSATPENTAESETKTSPARCASSRAIVVFPTPGGEALDTPSLAALLARRAVLYDKDREEHFNLISALHKSLRGSDPDAALYWFARMLTGGEDPRYIARRLTRFAAEDVGMADPRALPLAIATWETYERLGTPEGELALAQLVVHLATAPKSNAVYVAFGEAMRAAKETGSLMPPQNILNAPTRLMKDLGYGAGYEYDHDAEEGFSGADYWPEGMERRRFYQPTDRGAEAAVAERMRQWDAIRAKRGRRR